MSLKYLLQVNIQTSFLHKSGPWSLQPLYGMDELPIGRETKVQSCLPEHIEGKWQGTKNGGSYYCAHWDCARQLKCGRRINKC